MILVDVLLFKDPDPVARKVPDLDPQHYLQDSLKEDRSRCLQTGRVVCPNFGHPSPNTVIYKRYIIAGKK